MYLLRVYRRGCSFLCRRCAAVSVSAIAFLRVRNHNHSPARIFAIDELLEAVLAFCVKPESVSSDDRRQIAIEFRRHLSLFLDLLRASGVTRLLERLQWRDE